MNPLPPLTDLELGLLRESVERDGVRGNPVLLDRSGNIIDGHHRLKIADELGIEWPAETLDVDDETADRLRWTLNLARRHLSALDRAEYIAHLTSRHEADARAEAKQRQRESGGPVGSRPEPTGPGRGPRADDVIAERINADLASVGENMRVTRSSVEKARRVAKLAPEAKQRIRDGRSTVQEEAWHRGGRKNPVNTGTARTRPSMKEDLDQAARIRARDAEFQFQSMLNAPPAKLNLPLVRRAEKVQELLTELVGLDPAVAVTQLPAERCRDFTPAHAEWWAEFAALCEKRRREETPGLAPRPYRPPNATLNPVVLGTADFAKEERHLQPNERAVLDWLRTQEEPATVTQIAIALRVRSKQAIQTRIRTLSVSGLVEVAGKAGKESAYRAVAQESRT